MKARTKFEKQVAASNVRLTSVDSKAFEWGVRNLIKHPAFRIKSGKTTCGDCGCDFIYKGKGKFAVCPHCGQRLEISYALKRSHKEGTYFAMLDTIDGLQVERVFLLSAYFKKGESVSITHNEVCRLWLNAKGQTALTSKAKSMGYYRDCFNWCNKQILNHQKLVKFNHQLKIDYFV